MKNKNHTKCVVAEERLELPTRGLLLRLVSGARCPYLFIPLQQLVDVKWDYHLNLFQCSLTQRIQAQRFCTPIATQWSLRVHILPKGQKSTAPRRAKTNPLDKSFCDCFDFHAAKDRSASHDHRSFVGYLCVLASSYQSKTCTNRVVPYP